MTKVADKTSTATMGGTHQDNNYYSTSYTRSTRCANYKVEKLNMEDYTEYWLVTPELAREILATCENNRTIRRARVDQYYHDIVTGAWKPAGNEIALDPDGKLLDGQHRLSAIERFGKPVPVRVHLNVPKDTPFDIGAGRTSGDALKMQGEIGADLTTRNYTALVNAIFRTTLGSTAFKKVTNADRRDLIWRYEDDLRFIIGASGTNSNHPCRKAGVQAGMFAALRAGITAEELVDFAEKTNSGTGIVAGREAANVLRTALLKNVYGNRGGNSIMELTYATEQAISDYISWKPRTNAYHPTEGCYTKNLKQEFGEWYLET